MPQLCKDPDCPVREWHNEGKYEHNNQPPRRDDTIFEESNPPPHVWESLKLLESGKGDNNDYKTVFSFLIHVPKAEYSSTEFQFARGYVTFPESGDRSTLTTLAEPRILNDLFDDLEYP